MTAFITGVVEQAAGILTKYGVHGRENWYHMVSVLFATTLTAGRPSTSTFALSGAVGTPNSIVIPYRAYAFSSCFSNRPHSTNINTFMIEIFVLSRKSVTHTHPSINVPPHIVILAILFDMNFNLEGEYFIFPLTC